MSPAGHVDKLPLAEIDPHMGVGMVYMEEYQIARTLFTNLDALQSRRHVPASARKFNAIAGIDMLDKATAIKAGAGGSTAVAIG
jgi:hypothetical protein